MVPCTTFAADINSVPDVENVADISDAEKIEDAKENIKTENKEDNLAAKVLDASTVANYFNGKVGSSYPNGKCLAFVADSFQNLGAVRSSTCCAYNYGNMHIQSNSYSDIPIGADVFFGNCGGGPCKTCGSSYYGHIGVYVGGGYFVHATGGKVQKSALSSWKSKYRGWGYHGNVSISQTESQSHNPEGVVDDIEGGNGSIHLRGWAFDRDALGQSVQIHVYIGGEAGSGHILWSDGSGVANVERTDVNSVYGVGNNHGYDYTLSVPLTGDFDVYVYAINIGGGDNVLLGKKRVTISPVTHDPEGQMDSIHGGMGTIYLGGWVFDRDVPDQAIEVHVYVGGPAGSADVKWVKTGIIADACRTDVDNVYGQGKYHGIDATLDVPLSGEYDVYVYAINAGGGDHNPCIGSGKVTIQEKDSTGPEITECKISDIGIDGYTVSCKVTDKSGVDRVQFPTWTSKNGQDDLADDWRTNSAYTGTKNGDVYSYRVKTSMHNNERGTYVTHIYAYDKYGNVNAKALDSLEVPDMPDSTMELGNDFYAKIQNYVTKTMLTKVNTGKEWDAYFQATDDSREQIWHFVRNDSEESYTISCEGNEPLVLSVEEEEDSDYKNVKVDLRSESSGQKWKVLKKDGKYYLQPLCSETRVLDVKNAATDTVSAEINSYNEYGGCGFEIIKTENRTEPLQSKNLVVTGNYKGHSYQVFDQKMSWTDAERACEALGGHLVTIKDSGEQAFIQTLLKNKNVSMDLYWIGLYYRYKTGFTWVTDENYDYENWTSSYPLVGLAARGYCTLMYGDNQTASAFEWRNVNNAYAANIGVICEFETVKTSVDAVNGVLIGGRAADALRINWKKDSKASGYILEQYKNGSWTRIARIGSNTTTTYRVEKLAPSTTNQFRIQAFTFDGKTPIYGKYKYIN